MADLESVVKIQYDTAEAVKKIDELGVSIDANKAKQKQLRDQLKKNEISQQDYNKQMAETTATLGRESQERKKYVKVIQSEEGSIKRAKAENQVLREERNKLSLATKKGRKEAELYNKKIDENTKIIKGNVDQQSKLYMNMGKLGESIKGIPGPLGGVVNGMYGMVKASMAFIATGIGAVIAALGLAFLAVVKYLKGSEEGQNRLNKIMMVFKTLMGNLGDIVQKVGKWLMDAVTKPKEAIKELGELIQQNLINRFLAFGKIGKAVVKIFSKEWKEGLKDLGNATLQLTTGVENMIDKIVDGTKRIVEENKKEVAIAKQLADRQAALDKQIRKFLVDRARLESEIAENRAKAADKEAFTAEERLVFLQAAIDKENEILATNEKIAREKFELKKQQNALSNSTKEDLDEQAQLEADILNVQTQNALKRKSLNAELTTVQRELNKATEEQGEVIDEVSEKEQQAQAEMDKRRGEAIMKLAEAKARELEIEAQSLKDKRDLQAEAANAELEAKLEQEGLLKEEIELAEFEHKQRMQEIEAEYQENLRMQRQMALDESFMSMQQIISATDSFANQRVNIISDAFSRIATINLKEVKSASDAFVAIGSAAQGLTNLIVSGNEAQLDDLEMKKQAELAVVGDNTAAREHIEAKYNKKLVAIKKAQAKEDKKKAIIDASIATALGVVKALGSAKPPANFILAGIVGTLGGVQIATIGRQQQPEFSSDKIFARGGSIVDGASHSKGGVNIFGDNGQYFGQVEGSEAMFVMKKDATAEIAALSAINESHGGRSFNTKVNHAAEGGQLSGADIRQTVNDEINRTPIFVRVGDIETGMTETNNVKNAGVV